jgi:hypothetical protein
MRLFVGHAESPWMPRLRWASRWLALGLALGAALDLAVRLAAG